MATVTANYLPAAGREAVDLTSWAGDAAFATTPVSGNQIEGPDTLTYGADGTITGADGTYTLYQIIGATGAVESVSYTIGTVDATAPILTALTAIGTDPDTIDVSVTTDEGNGTLYVYASTNAFESAATVKSSAQGIQAVSATGAQTIALTLAVGSYYVHAMHEDAATNQSAVVSSAQVTLAELPQTASVVTSYVPPAGLTLVTFEEPIEHYIDQNWTAPIEANDQALFDPALFTLDKHANWRAEAEGVHSYWYINNIGQVFNPTFTAQNLPVVPDNDVVIDTITKTRNTITIEFTYAGTDAGGFEYSVDGSAWASTTSPLVITGLTPATAYVVDIRPVSSAGVPGPATTRTVTTNAAVDTTPDAYSFTALTNVARNVPQVSNAITVKGVDAGVDVPISVVGGEYSTSTDSGATWGNWTSTAGVVRLNHRVRARHTSSNEYSSGGYNGVRSTALDIGGTLGTFTSTTLADTTAPVISLVGGNMNWPQGTPWQEPGYSAIDAADGDISVSGTVVTGTVDVNTLGQYSLTYTATDRSGNVAQTTRIVTVVVALPDDQIKPVITLNGGNTTVEQGQPWVEPGYTAYDNIDGDLTQFVSVTGTVNTGVIGQYQVTYSVTDAAGNTGTATRTVTVYSSVVYPFDQPAPDRRTYAADRPHRLEMGASTFVMQSGEILDFDYDLTQWLASQGDDTLVDGSHSIVELSDSLVVLASGKVSGMDRIKAWIEAGSISRPGEARPVQLTITTVGGRTAVFQFYLVVIDRLH